MQTLLDLVAIKGDPVSLLAAENSVKLDVTSNDAVQAFEAVLELLTEEVQEWPLDKTQALSENAAPEDALPAVQLELDQQVVHQLMDDGQSAVSDPARQQISDSTVAVQTADEYPVDSSPLDLVEAEFITKSVVPTLTQQERSKPGLNQVDAVEVPAEATRLAVSTLTLTTTVSETSTDDRIDGFGIQTSDLERHVDTDLRPDRRTQGVESAIRTDQKHPFAEHEIQRRYLETGDVPQVLDGQWSSHKYAVPVMFEKSPMGSEHGEPVRTKAYVDQVQIASVAPNQAPTLVASPAEAPGLSSKVLRNDALSLAGADLSAATSEPTTVAIDAAAVQEKQPSAIPIQTVQNSAPLVGSTIELRVKEAGASTAQFEAEPIVDSLGLGAADTPERGAQDLQRAISMSRMPDLPRHITSQLVEAARLNPDQPVELTLNPEELGRLKMSFHGEAGQMSVTLLFERAETMELMRRHIDQLTQDMRSLGYEDVSFSFQQNGDGQRGTEREGFSGDATTFDARAPDSEPGAVSELRIDTGLDIRI